MGGIRNVAAEHWIEPVPVRVAPSAFAEHHDIAGIAKASQCSAQ
jgi:hypothetical protein